MESKRIITLIYDTILDREVTIFSQNLQVRSELDVNVH